MESPVEASTVESKVEVEGEAVLHNVSFTFESGKVKDVTVQKPKPTETP